MYFGHHISDASFFNMLSFFDSFVYANDTVAVAVLLFIRRGYRMDRHRENSTVVSSGTTDDMTVNTGGGSVLTANTGGTGGAAATDPSGRLLAG